MDQYYLSEKKKPVPGRGPREEIIWSSFNDYTISVIFFI
jgi:hypothetical protein